MGGKNKELNDGSLSQKQKSLDLHKEFFHEKHSMRCACGANDLISETCSSDSCTRSNNLHISIHTGILASENFSSICTADIQLVCPCPLPFSVLSPCLRVRPSSCLCSVFRLRVRLVVSFVLRSPFFVFLCTPGILSQRPRSAQGPEPIGIARLAPQVRKTRCRPQA